MIDIADVAEQTLLLEACGASLRPRWIERRGEALGDRARNPFLGWETMPDVRVHAWRVRDVVLDGTTMVLQHKSRIIRQSVYHRSAQELLDMQVDPARAVRIETDLPVLVCGDAWASNHYHFLNHTFPAIDAAIGRHGQQGIVLAAHWMRPVHEHLLRLLGYREQQSFRLEPERQYAIQNAVFCSYTVGVADFANSEAIQGLHDRIAARIPDTGGVGEKIYVSRLGDRHRRAAGEAELVAALRRRGFAIVTPAEMSLEQQVDAFRAARLVVGPHGAGLANISFCRPGAAVYDLLPEHFIDSSILNLAIRRGMRAWIDAFPGEGDTTDHTRDWTLHVPAVLARLDEIEARPWWRRWT